MYPRAQVRHRNREATVYLPTLGGDKRHPHRVDMGCATGTVVAQAIAVQLIPSGQPRRIDAPDAGNCNFPN
jgi:hypothetical protein